LFAALNVATGEVIARCKPQHRAQDFVGFLRELDDHVDPSLEVHVVLDNLSTQKGTAGASVHAAASEVPSALHADVCVVAQPRRAFFGLLTEQALKRGSFTSIPQLCTAIVDYVASHNHRNKPWD
jgi:hypothetical protein